DLALVCALSSRNPQLPEGHLGHLYSLAILQRDQLHAGQAAGMPPPGSRHGHRYGYQRLQRLCGGAEAQLAQLCCRLHLSASEESAYFLAVKRGLSADPARSEPPRTVAMAKLAYLGR